MYPLHELFSKLIRLTNVARPTCVVALDQCVRSACVATLTIRSFPYRNGTPFAPAVLKVLRSSKYSLLTSWARRSALAPFRLSMFFLFRGGDFLKLNGRKRDSVGLLLGKKPVGNKFNIEPHVICYR